MKHAIVPICLALFVVAGIWGWVWNIVKIVGAGFDVINGMMIARIIGVFIPPLGSVLGFC